MRTITKNELVELLARIVTAQPITITALVDARCKKTGNPFSEVKKLSQVNGFTGANYENSVNRQLAREYVNPETFDAASRQWGERISPCLVKNKDKHYLVIQPKHSKNPIYFGRNGWGEWQIVSKDLINKFLPAHKVSEKQTYAGINKEVVYRNYAIENIRTVRMLGETFKIKA